MSIWLSTAARVKVRTLRKPRPHIAFRPRGISIIHKKIGSVFIDDGENEWTNAPRTRNTLITRAVADGVEVIASRVFPPPFRPWSTDGRWYKFFRRKFTHYLSIGIYSLQNPHVMSHSAYANANRQKWTAQWSGLPTACRTHADEFNTVGACILNVLSKSERIVR